MAEPTEIYCGNCEKVLSETEIRELHEVKDLFSRMCPGEVVPAGECIVCGTLAHLRTKIIHIPKGGTCCPDCQGNRFERIGEDLYEGSLDQEGRLNFHSESVYDNGAVTCSDCGVHVDLDPDTKISYLT